LGRAECFECSNALPKNTKSGGGGEKLEEKKQKRVLLGSSGRGVVKGRKKHK
jgi:hypothetical protein